MGEDVKTTRDFKWGLSKIAVKQPHARRSCAFCQIDTSLFVTSDGANTYFWTNAGLDTKLACPALSLAHIEKNHHIIASVRGSAHLHFIPLQKPYKVCEHPATFSSKTITSMFFFAHQSILVTAGQGISFTTMKLPRPPQSASQFIEFSRITEVLEDEIFTFMNPPVFVEDVEAVLAPVHKSLYIYSLNGKLITVLNQVSRGDISSVAFDSKTMTIVVGDTEGNVFCVEYGASFPTTKSDLSTGSHLLSCRPYDRYFMVTVSVSGIIGLHCLINGYEMSQFQLQNKPFTVRSFGDFVFIFSAMGIDAFKVSVFMEHFKGVEADVKELRRMPRSQILGFMTNASVFVCRQKKKAEMRAEIRSKSMSNEVARIALQDQTLGLVFEKGGMLLLNLEEKQQRFCVVSAEDEGSVRVPPDVHSSGLLMEIFSDAHMFGIASTGHLYKFSIQEKRVISVEFFRELTEATAVAKNGEKLIIAAHEGIFNIDVATIRITEREKCEPISAILVVNGFGVVCGSAYGAVELRDQQTLKPICSSRYYNAVHSPTSLFGVESSESVKSIDYLPKSGLLLTISNSGEIFVWTRDLYPVAHFEMSFLVTSACFLDNGGILVSALCHLFVINPNQFLESELQEEECVSSSSSASIVAPPVVAAPRPSAPVEPPRKARKVTKSRVIISETTSDESEDVLVYTEPSGPEWEDLIVEQEVIPKCHFVSRKIAGSSSADFGSRSTRQGISESEMERIRGELRIQPDQESTEDSEAQIQSRRKKKSAKGKRKKASENQIKNRQTEEGASTQKLPTKTKPRRAKSARVTQLLYPEERSAQQREAKFGKLNRSNEDRKRASKELSSTDTTTTSQTQPKPPKENQVSVRSPQNQAPRRNPRRVATTREREITWKPFSFDKRKTETKQAESEEQNTKETEVIDKTVIELENETSQGVTGLQIEVDDDDGTRIDMNAAMVDFIAPAFDYGSLGNCDIEQMQREVEARTTRNVIVKQKRSTKKKKSERIRVFKVRRASSARRP